MECSRTGDRERTDRRKYQAGRQRRETQQNPRNRVGGSSTGYGEIERINGGTVDHTLGTALPTLLGTARDTARI